jgi:endo-1,4-beta-xylanase
MYIFRCLDAELSTNGRNGTKVQLWDCTGRLNQKWVWPGYAFGTGIVGSENRNGGTFLESHFCLDADLGTIEQNGTQVQLWTCNGGRNQYWLNPGITPSVTFNP